MYATRSLRLSRWIPISFAYQIVARPVEPFWERTSRSLLPRHGMWQRGYYQWSDAVYDITIQTRGAILLSLRDHSLYWALAHEFWVYCQQDYSLNWAYQYIFNFRTGFSYFPSTYHHSHNRTWACRYSGAMSDDSFWEATYDNYEDPDAPYEREGVSYQQGLFQEEE